jgi:protein-S-isoprenylcysteine O-methyltransferase Ste14
MDRFAVFYLIGFALAMLFRIHYAGGRPRGLRATGTGRRRIELAGLVLWGLGQLGVVGRALVPGLTRYDYPMIGVGRWLGLLLFAGGLWLIWRGHAALGPSWSAGPEPYPSHVLVTHGVYARLRHPLYAGHLLWNLGLCLMVPSPFVGPPGLLGMLVFTAARIPAEERAMLDRFGDSYRDYRLRTGALFPRSVLCRGRN